MISITKNTTEYHDAMFEQFFGMLARVGEDQALRSGTPTIAYRRITPATIFTYRESVNSIGETETVGSFDRSYGQAFTDAVSEAYWLSGLGNVRVFA